METMGLTTVTQPLFLCLSIVTTTSGHPSSLADVYLDTTMSAVNWLEHVWVAWYVWIDNTIIATEVF